MPVCQTGVGRAEVLLSSIVIQVLTKVCWFGGRSDSPNQAVSPRPAALAGSAGDMCFMLLLLERSMPEMYINSAFPSHAVCLPNFLSRTVRVSPRRIVWAGSAAAVRSSNLYAYSIAVLHGKCLQSVLLKSALLLVECHASAFCFLMS